MPSYLMCEPTHYAIEYEINPWMSLRRRADGPRALAQWRQLVAVLRDEVGADVRFVEPGPHLPDMCFTANAGYVCGGLAVPSSFRPTQRRGEQPLFERWFRENGFEVRPLPADYYFEGAGDFLDCGDRIIAGYYFRSDIHSHLALSQLLDVPVVSVQLADPRFYHLDTCFCALEPGTAMYYPPAFDEYARAALRYHLCDLLEVGEADALSFGCNAVVANGSVVLNEPCRDLGAALADRGYSVHYVDLGEFLKAGGSAKCLTLRLDEPCPGSPSANAPR
jgi:N-dimethylarginine dimethylaminohydrolase